MTRFRENRFVALACVAIVAACMMVFVKLPAAHAISGDELDIDSTGSISITMKENGTGKLVPGGEVSVVRVGDIARDGSSLAFVPNNATLSSGLGFDDIGSDDLAIEYYDFVKSNNLSTVTRGVSLDATVKFADLPLGVYLVMQETPASGYNAFLPFLVTVPAQENDEWIIDVDATPKVELYTSPIPEKPETPASPPPGEKLPQTGQLNWPVWALGVLGIWFLGAGWFILRRGRRKAERDAC